MEELVAVYLSPEEAELFKKFREHQELFQVMLLGQVHEVYNGTAEIFFNQGKILDITIRIGTYKRQRVRIPLDNVAALSILKVETKNINPNQTIQV